MTFVGALLDRCGGTARDGENFAAARNIDGAIALYADRQEWVRERMRLPKHICAATLLVIWASAPSLAQTSDQPRLARGVTAEVDATAIESRRLESVLGLEIRTRVEEHIGRIVDLLAGRDGQVEAAVIEFGGFLGIGTRKIAVEWSALRFDRDGGQSIAIVDMTRDQLRTAPEYKPGEQAVVLKTAK